MGVPLSRVHSHVTRLPSGGPVCAFYTMKLEKCLTCHVLVRRNFGRMCGLSNKLGACHTTATPVVLRRGRRASSAPSTRSDPTGPSIKTRTPRAAATTGPGAVQISTYKLRYPNPILGVGGAVSALIPNREIRVITASPKFSQSTTT